MGSRDLPSILDSFWTGNGVVPGHDDRETVVDVADDGREQETELSLTNRARHLCKNNGVAELVKTRLSPYALPC